MSQQQRMLERLINTVDKDFGLARQVLDYQSQRAFFATVAKLASKHQIAATELLEAGALPESEYRPALTIARSARPKRTRRAADVGLVLRIGRRLTQPVASLSEAINIYNDLRDQSGEGGSTFPTGSVGRYKISYNGRLWDGDNPVDPIDPSRPDARALKYGE
jgi:hypothetical protein